MAPEPHDAVRPLVDQRIIADCVRALRIYPAVDVVIRSSDTIVAVDRYSGECIRDIPDRASLRRGQTPQGFHFGVLRESYRRAREDGGSGWTDDCGVVLRYLPTVPIGVVEGDEHNIKIARPVDVYVADRPVQLTSLAVAAPEPEGLGAALRGHAIAVFGETSGVGRRICDFAAESGAGAYAFSRSGSGTDVADPDSVADALAHVYADAGRVDHVVNAAAVLVRGDLAALEQSEIGLSLATNLTGALNVERAAHPFLVKSQGQLLFFTSSSYTRGRAGYSVYSATKAAIVNVTQALADEWSADGIRVNCVNPERTATPMRMRTLLSPMTGQIVDVRRDLP